MKQLIKTITAFSASAVIAVCSAISGAAIGADTTETKTYTVHFDLSEEGVSIAPDENDNIPEITDITKKSNSSFFIPDAELVRDGYKFSGWTEDDIKGYVKGEVCRVTDHDITLHPVWSVADDKEFHTVTFRVEWDGQIDKEAEALVPPAKRQAGKFVTIPLYTFPRAGYKQRGWTDGTTEFAGEEHLIVHDEDITLVPNLKKIYNLTYSVGDADRINGVTYLQFEIAETTPTNLQNNDRFSRNGFRVSGWHCENDGKDYEPVAQFIMPSEDVLMTPIWEPIKYTINFKPSSNTADYIKVQGFTDTAITAPECSYVKEGYTFAGWKRDDVIIQPGEEYIIPGAAPGMGISFTAVWTEESGDTTTTTASGETSTTTTTSATTTTTTSSATTSTTSSETTATTTVSTTAETTSSETTATTTTVTTTNESEVTLYGDSNCDGNIDMADAVLIMQALANPDKYDVSGTSENHITETGRLNADVEPSVKGLTTNDALTIQLYLLKKIDDLPVAIELPVIDFN
ncbi:dockerin type I repeat-containing protein [Ruminococcus sp.]|uniref:dockerin type I repeat-containing protein n=1 Tax=Ruminococcus sp. TaxID=41978 RepID=UPI0025CF0BF9|nr:dockerin type I repeat-containing protein [Ruminococcus sp.]